MQWNVKHIYFLLRFQVPGYSGWLSVSALFERRPGLHLVMLSSAPVVIMHGHHLLQSGGDEYNNAGYGFIGVDGTESVSVAQKKSEVWLNIFLYVA